MGQFSFPCFIAIVASYRGFNFQNLLLLFAFQDFCNEIDLKSLKVLILDGL